MEKENSSLLNLLSKTSEIEKLLTTVNEPGIPWQKTTLKTIYKNPEFILWKNQLKYHLQEAPQDKLVQETISLLDNGFESGFRDERNFNELKAKLALIAENPEKYDTMSYSDNTIRKKQSMKKGTKIKTAFDEYTLITQVGSGGNGRVFLATNAVGEQIAIKFLERDIGKEKLKRFKNEIAFCEKHKHDNIVQVLDRGYVYLDGKDYVFYVMPFFPDTLKDKIKAGLSPDDAINIFIGILKGLKYAHEHDTIHRDIKPENILFAKGSLEPVICDFGIAHFAEKDLFTAIETKPGDRMANFYYAAPEQYSREIVTQPQADVYSAGLILNEMFTREIPKAVGYKKISEVNADYGYLDDVVEQLFKQKPNERLYPEDRIISEIKVLAEKNQKDKEVARLQAVVNELNDPGNFEMKIIEKNYINGNVIFTFDREIPYEWFRIIQNADFGSCSFLMGYGPQRLTKRSSNAISMPISISESPDSIRKIAENIKDWASKTNSAYSAYLKRAAQKEQREKEEARKIEIAKLERETSINAVLAQL